MAVNPNMTDAERLAQIMQGNLAGQLTGGDKLMALSALLRSVSRGRTQTPEQVFQGIQQQKAQEVQSRLQMDQLRKQAERQASLEALRTQYIANAPDPQTARELQLMSPEDFSAYLRERNKPQARDEYISRLQTYEELKKVDPVRAKAYWNMINRPQVVGSVESGLSVYEQPEPTFGNVDPAAIAEAKRRGLI